MPEEKPVDKTQSHDGVFAAATTQEEVVALTKIIEQHCPWPLIYELPDGTYQVGGLSRTGGRLNKEASTLILKEIDSYVSASMFKDIDANKFKKTIEALKKKD